MLLTGKKKLLEKFERYDLEVEDNHNFIAERVVVHNSNGRIGAVNGIEVAASMSLRRKRPVKMDGETEIECSFDDPEIKNNTYWFPFSIPAVRNLIQDLKTQYNVVILYGEVYGGSIQSLPYGIPKGKGLGYRAFGLKINGRFLDWDDFVDTCNKYGVETVPVVYRGPFSMELAKEYADGKTTMTNDGQIREGIVIYPVIERENPKIGRVVLKVIGTEYALSKHQEKDTTDI